MKGICLMLITSVAMVSCNESRRGNDSNINEESSEAAAELNNDKFAGTKQRDADFVYNIVESSYDEIKLAELGNQKSRTPEVKRIAQMLLIDHTASLNELKTIAQAKAISIPVEEGSDSKRRLENLAQESVEEFDQTWVKVMMGLHDENIREFQSRLEDTSDSELKAFINKTLPVLKKHHQSLEGFNEKMIKAAR